MGASLIVAAFIVLALIERKRPLRRSVEPKLRREVRNLAVAGSAAAVMALAERPFIQPLCKLVEARRWGLVPHLPRPLQLPVALVLMDYTFYFWHYLMHKVPFLWRFHMVHHSDLDLDTSTAIRFHAGELVASIPFRAAQVAVIGLSPSAFNAWQTSFLLAVLFHHSAVKLPIEWERWLNFFIVTPRMHGIHHSMVRDETDSNWSSGLTLWDRLHGTLRLDVPDDELRIGVPGYAQPDDVTLPRLALMPLDDPERAWQSQAQSS